MLFFLFSLLIASPLRIELTKGKLEPEPIGIPTFQDENHLSATETSIKLTKIIQNDLKNSGLLKIVFNKNIKQISTNQIPNFNQWKSARYVLYGGIKSSGSHAQINFRLYDVLQKKELCSESVKGEIRRAAHVVSNKVYEAITGEKGFFCSRFLLVQSYIQNKKLYRKLIIVDQDGENVKTIVNHPSKFILSAKVNLQGEIAYIYINPRKKLFFHFRGKDIPVSNLKNYAFDFETPHTILMSGAKNGTSAIYRNNLKTQEKILLTNHKNIHTSPFSYKDSIFYTSDESGTEQLYIANRDGSNAKRISFQKGRYSEPHIANDKIVFIRRFSKQFFVGIMDVDGSNEHLIHSSYLAEYPCFLKNNRYIAFVEGEKNKPQKLSVIRISGDRTSYRSLPLKNITACIVLD